MNSDVIILPSVQAVFLPPNSSHSPIITLDSIKASTDWSSLQRCYAWLFLLGVLPPTITDWATHFSNRTTEYWTEVDKHSLQEWHLQHWFPNRTIDSFGSDRLIGSIYIDVVRTGRIAGHFSPVDSLESHDPKDIWFCFHEHFRRLERLLFIFAMRTPQFGYLQGFNELASVLYSVMVKGLPNPFPSDRSRLDVCEALTFWCFENLMKEKGVLTVYCGGEGDDSLNCFLSEFKERLAKVMKVEAEILEFLGIEPLFYALRWFLLLFAQDWELPTVKLIWDELLCYEKEDFRLFLQCLGIAHLSLRTGELSRESYGQTIRAVQRKCTKSTDYAQMMNETQRIYKYLAELDEKTR
jgi:hypothetical protein